LSKIGDFDGTVGYIASAGLPMPQLAAVVAIAVEVLAPTALILGWGTRWAALVLALFTLVATLGFHNFWAMPADQAYLQQLMFFKNIAVVGGLLVLAAHGAGALSLDARRAAA
jgi:putative oxidoreductase